jgi:hypothetical protein
LTNIKEINEISKKTEMIKVEILGMYFEIKKSPKKKTITVWLKIIPKL